MNFQKLNTENITVVLCCYLIPNPQKEVLMSLFPMLFFTLKNALLLAPNKKIDSI